MKLPRDVDADVLLKALRPFGYSVSRQTGSHIRISTRMGGEHHEVIPNHRPLKVGTLQAVLRNIAAHHGISVAELLQHLDL